MSRGASRPPVSPTDSLRRAERFFEDQFRRQVAAGEYGLNPFEQAVLPLLEGHLLDLGCGLGNLSIAAARRGCRVSAFDASHTAVADLAARAAAEGLAVTARLADLHGLPVGGVYDSVACIGLLMFFAPDEARAGLARIRERVRPGGVAAVNVLVEGTTYLEMFDPAGYCLFGETELRQAFEGWTIELERLEAFAAPGGTVKRFATVVARRP